MRICSHCKSGYTDARAYCGRCGGRVGGPCARCGAVMASEDNFCGQCGLAKGARVGQVPGEGEAISPAGVGHDGEDFAGEVERDRARFARLAPRLVQQDITKLFDSPQEEGTND